MEYIMWNNYFGGNPKMNQFDKKGFLGIKVYLFTGAVSSLITYMCRAFTHEG